MAERDEYPGAVEGKIVDVNAMKISPNSRPQKKEGILYYPFKLRYARAEIICELDPKAWIIREGSMLNEGDVVSGIILDGLARGPLKTGDIKVGCSGATSGRHKRQSCSVKKFCFVEIIEGLRGVPAPAHTV